MSDQQPRQYQNWHSRGRGRGRGSGGGGGGGAYYSQRGRGGPKPTLLGRGGSNSYAGRGSGNGMWYQPLMGGNSVQGHQAQYQQQPSQLRYRPSFNQQQQQYRPAYNKYQYWQQKNSHVDQSLIAEEQDEDTKDGNEKEQLSISAQGQLNNLDQQQQQEDADYSISNLQTPVLEAQLEFLASSRRDEVKEDSMDNQQPQMNKQQIMKEMDKIDDQIAVYESMLDDLKKAKLSPQKSEAERKPSVKEELPNVDELASSPATIKPISQKLVQKSPQRPKLWQKSRAVDDASFINRILQDNRDKAQRSQETFQQDCGNIPFSVGCLEPSSFPFYNENIQKFQSFKPVLVKYLQRKRFALQDKEEYLQRQYNDLFNQWQEQALLFEDQQIKISIKQQNKQQSRGNSRKVQEDLWSLVNVYDPAATPYGPPSSDEDYRYLKSVTAPTPMLLDIRMREQMKYIDNNNLFDDGQQSVKQITMANPWNDDEKKIFIQAYMEYPKEFGRIASFLPNKSSQDCVQYYYLNKKSLKLKALTKQALALKNRKRKKALAQQQSADNQGFERQMQQQQQFILQQQQQKDQDYDGDYGSGAVSQFSQNQSVDAGNDHKGRSRDASLQPIQQQREILPGEIQEWDDQEVDRVKALFLEHGKDFRQIAQLTGTKSILQVRRLYLYFKRYQNVDLTKPLSSNSKGDRQGQLQSKDSLDQDITEDSQDLIHQSAASSTDNLMAESFQNPSGHSASVGQILQDGKESAGSQPLQQQQEKKKKRGRPSKNRQNQAAIQQLPQIQELPQVQSPKEKKKTVSYWTAKEKVEFQKLAAQFGRDFKSIAERLPAKSEIQVRNFYNSTIDDNNGGNQSFSGGADSATGNKEHSRSQSTGIEHAQQQLQFSSGQQQQESEQQQSSQSQRGAPAPFNASSNVGVGGSQPHGEEVFYQNPHMYQNSQHIQPMFPFQPYHMSQDGYPIPQYIFPPPIYTGSTMHPPFFSAPYLPPIGPHVVQHGPASGDQSMIQQQQQQHQMYQQQHQQQQQHPQYQHQQQIQQQQYAYRPPVNMTSHPLSSVESNSAVLPGLKNIPIVNAQSGSGNSDSQLQDQDVEQDGSDQKADDDNNHLNSAQQEQSGQQDGDGERLQSQSPRLKASISQVLNSSSDSLQ
ncbi:hypothetical protein MP228_006021 [Amoeboaphelidium protococcarum]|nr:hypothetical protein MP228_006021 [Amoeboaphelidium protococcarum]